MTTAVHTSLEDILAHKAGGSWRTLAARAKVMIADAALHAGAKFEPQLGGGTRLMLALNHRISDDIDLFIRDPQWIGYLTPRLNDNVGDSVNNYSENAVSLKLEYDEGEIDFIVGMSLLGLPDETSPDTTFILEPVAEVLAKKLFYRGWGLTPRDLYDWWCIETMLPGAVPVEKMAHLLKTKFPEIERALANITTSGSASTMWSAIRAPHKPALSTAANWAKETLTGYAQVAHVASLRIAMLPELQRLAGTKYALWEVATEEIGRTGSIERVDWAAVERSVATKSLYEYGQDPADVLDALCRYSPGAVAASSQAALRDYVSTLTNSAAAAPRTHDTDVSSEP